jgi:hypothetical protein
LALLTLVVDDGKPLPSLSPTAAKTNTPKKSKISFKKPKIVLSDFYCHGMIFQRFFVKITWSEI